jgi:hypothetical protein
LAAPVTGGDPMTEAKYVRGSLQHLSEALAERGHAACPHTVAGVRSLWRACLCGFFELFPCVQLVGWHFDRLELFQ